MKLIIYLKEYINEKRIDKICNEVSQEYNCKVSHFRDIKKIGRGSYHYIPGYGDRNLWEGISPEQFGIDKHKSGIIVFSTDVNAADLSKNKVKNLFSKKWKTITNRIMKDKKMAKHIKSKFKEIGAFSIGNFFKSRYIKNGKVFDEKSISIEILGVPSKVLIRLATEIARKFDKDTVLLKDYETDRNILIDQS